MEGEPEQMNSNSRKDSGGRRKRTQRPREFNLSRAARETYGFNDALFSSTGNQISSRIQSIRDLVHAMNRHRDVTVNPERVVHVSSVNALGLMDQLFHHLLLRYREDHETGLFEHLLDELYATVGRKEVDAVLHGFTDEFPPADVYRELLTTDAYLDSVESGESGRVLALEELFLLWIENQNPAFLGFEELLSVDSTSSLPGYDRVMAEMERMVASLSAADTAPLLDLLLEPARHEPDSLEGQLRYIRQNWGTYLGDLVLKVLRGLDLFKEDQKGFFAGPGPGETKVYQFGGQEAELERFSQDREWMPRVVMIAKNILVWLYQLSREHGREIRTLDQIPDRDLDRLASWGFTALWLIGIWERSPASRRIKRKMGNGEAEGSAYSLLGYEIAAELGGWDALETLKTRCAARGIRLASDMVPNHTGIDSTWIDQHPERFIQVSEPPFPGYTFSGENLSRGPDIGVYLEDHYFDRTDAAVVFKRVDNRSGEIRYIYHGNDGTHMPWNDTAQLDFLNPETRDAVIDTILHVARVFPIIRFDAAMTLARRHYHRLWFPEPGTGGDIPSRADHGLTADEFNRAMPNEFWREVVDRVGNELPDTLLLAEAFWMMEGYFVRTLGMHRVYNSAFMNMLKNQENAKYRETIKNTLEFDRNILKRFVNFMNNPDEETAVAQFGREDKYFGICTMLVTMPGLPMFGHGQIEGFAEKYGMEYRRSYLAEEPDSVVVTRHEREIFPLIKKRYLFAEVENFSLFDLYANDGTVNENVFAYTNRHGHESALILYNNAYERAWGWIRVCAAFAQKDEAGERVLVQKDLSETLGLHRDASHYCLLFENRTGLWFIRNSAELAEKGLHVGLAGYQCQVFTGIREEKDTEAGLYGALERQAAGNGVPDIDAALRDIHYRPLYAPLAPALARDCIESIFSSLEHGLDPKRIEPFFKKYENFLLSAVEFGDLGGRTEDALSYARSCTASSATLLADGLPENSQLLAAIVGWILLSPLAYLCVDSASMLDDWEIPSRISAAVTPVMAENYRQALNSPRYESLLRILLRHESWFDSVEGDSPASGNVRDAARHILRDLCEDAEVTRFLGFNTFEGAIWFQKESFEILSWALAMVGMIRVLAQSEAPAQAAAEQSPEMKRIAGIAVQWSEMEAESGFRVDHLLDQ